MANGTPSVEGHYTEHPRANSPVCSGEALDRASHPFPVESRPFAPSRRRADDGAGNSHRSTLDCPTGGAMPGPAPFPNRGVAARVAQRKLCN